MLNTQLHTLLQTIDKKEMTAFGHYLNGIHSGKKRILKVHEYLNKSHPDYNVPRMVRAKVKDYVFSRSVNDKTLLNLYSDLHNYLEDFLAIKELDDHSFVKNYLLIRYYEKRQATQLFFKQVEVSQEGLGYENVLKEEKPKKKLGLFYFFKSFLLHHFKYFHSNSPTFIMQQNNYEVQMARTDLNQFAEIANLGYQAEILNRQKLFKVNNTSPIHNTEEYLLLSKLYQLKLNLLSSQSEANYNELKNFFFSKIHYFDNQEHISTLTYLFNFPIHCIKKGNTAYAKELFNLYKFSFAEGILIIQDYLSSSQFHNIVSIASSLGEYIWLEKFLIHYEKTIVLSNYENVLKLGHSQLLFGKKDFSEVINKLKDIKYENPYFEYRSKALVLRSYYSLDESEDLILNYCRSFRAILQRNEKVHIKLKEGYINFIKYFKELVLGLKPVEDIIQNICDEDCLQCRKWLLEELDIKR